MRHGRSYLEEEQLGKAFDARLLRRLSRYLRPYIWLFVLAFLLSGGITVIEIALPYITKTAIDSVLTPPWVEITAEKPPIPGAIPLQEGHYLVRYSLLPRTLRETLELKGELGERYLLVRESDPGSALAAKYPQLFRPIPGGYAVSARSLRELPREELVLLRGKSVRTLVILALVFLGFLLVRFFLSYGQVYTLQYAGQRIMADMRREIFFHILRLPMSFLDKQPVGRLVTRATNDVAAINEMFTQGLVNLVQDIFMMVGVMVIMFRLEARLALLVLAFGPVLFGLAAWFRAKARSAYREARRRLARLNAYLQEALSGIQIIQLFLQEIRSFRRFAEINRDYYRAQMRSLLVYSIFGPAISAMQHIAIALLIWYGGRGVLSGTLTLGALVAFTSYVRMFFQPLSDLSERYNIFQAAMAAAERILGLLDRPREETGTKVLAALRGEIEFRDVWFAYNDEEWVLKGISFRVRPGERIAIVGPTGSGKTTIVNLLLGLYRPQRGKILVDGVELGELDLEAFRKRVAIVPQDVFLFAGDILENIRLWDERVPPERVELAARRVGLDELLSRLPQGFSTDVRERGARLSLGERQLISLARAVVADPRILILDEATSSIDSHTEALVQRSLHELMQGRTTIAIAHRLSTIRDMDRVLVLHEGELVEEGTVEELLSRKGLFRALWELQFKGASSAAD
jgi:ABC-type multidrug transport system fused ATPase/permease subunit